MSVLFFSWLVLLIVPYGIETRAVLVFPYGTVLLIVPYGIETRYRKDAGDQECSF